MIDDEGLIKEARERAHHKAVRACITWLHARAEEMNDPHARQVLNSAAFALGLDRPDALEARVLSPSEGDFGLLGPKEALHAAADGECEAGWRSIESAPRDGIELLLLVYGRAVQGSWVGPSDGAIYAGRRSVYNWFTGVTEHDDGVTHWMPLPAPPEDGLRHPVAADGEAISEGDVATEHNTPPNIPTAETGGEG